MDSDRPDELGLDSDYMPAPPDGTVASLASSCGGVLDYSWTTYIRQVVALSKSTSSVA